MARAIAPTADSSSDEARELRERLARLDREAAERAAEAHAALAAAQDRSYWLDRWRIDLNALMRKPGAGIVRAGLRALRALYRLVYDTRNRTGKAVDATREKVEGARVRLEREGGGEEAVVAERLPFQRLRVTPVTDALAGTLNGRVDPDDPRALAALTRADAIVGALADTGVAPAAGQVWLGVGPTADEVLRLLGAAYPDLLCRAEDALAGDEVADAAFAVSGWANADAASERLDSLHAAIKPGGSLVVGAERGAHAVVTPAWLAANATPAWRVALYLPGGLEGDRDLYVLERA